MAFKHTGTRQHTQIVCKWWLVRSCRCWIQSYSFTPLSAISHVLFCHIQYYHINTGRYIHVLQETLYSPSPALCIHIYFPLQVIQISIANTSTHPGSMQTTAVQHECSINWTRSFLGERWTEWILTWVLVSPGRILKIQGPGGGVEAPKSCMATLPPFNSWRRTLFVGKSGAAEARSWSRDSLSRVSLKILSNKGIKSQKISLII